MSTIFLFLQRQRSIDSTLHHLLFLNDGMVTLSVPLRGGCEKEFSHLAKRGIRVLEDPPGVMESQVGSAVNAEFLQAQGRRFESGH